MAEPSDVPSRALRHRVAWLDAAVLVCRSFLEDGGVDVRRVATSAARSAAAADVASLVLPSGEAGELTNVTSVGLGADVYEGLTFLARDSALGRTIVAGEPLQVAQILPWATDHDDPPNPVGLGPAMTLPVHDSQGRNAAFVLSRTSDRAPFDENEQEFAAPFAELVTVALRQADERVNMTSARDLAEHALHDDLTQRLFAIGVGLQSVLERAGDSQTEGRLRGYLGDLDEMIVLLHPGGATDPPTSRPPLPSP